MAGLASFPGQLCETSPLPKPADPLTYTPTNTEVPWYTWSSRPVRSRKDVVFGDHAIPRNPCFLCSPERASDFASLYQLPRTCFLRPTRSRGLTTSEEWVSYLRAPALRCGRPVVQRPPETGPPSVGQGAPFGHWIGVLRTRLTRRSQQIC